MLASRGILPPRDQTQVSCVSCIASRFFTSESLGKPTYVYVCAFVIFQYISKCSPEKQTNSMCIYMHTHSMLTCTLIHTCTYTHVHPCSHIELHVFIIIPPTDRHSCIESHILIYTVILSYTHGTHLHIIHMYNHIHNHSSHTDISKHTKHIQVVAYTCSKCE